MVETKTEVKEDETLDLKLISLCELLFTLFYQAVCWQKRQIV